MRKQNKSRILHLTCSYRQGFGVGLVIKKLNDELIKTGHYDLFVASPDIDEESPDGQVGLIKIDNELSSVKRVIGNIVPDVVVVHTPPYWDMIPRIKSKGLQFKKIAYDYGEPYTVLFRKGSEVREYLSNVEKSKAGSLRKYDSHISISQSIKRDSGINDSTVVYCGCDHFQKNFLSGFELRKHLGIAKDEIIITFLSRIGVVESHYKGFDALFEIAKILKTRFGYKKFHIVIMGRAVPKNNPVERVLRRKKIILLENVSEEMKNSVLVQSDLFISTSFWEGFNLPLVEAQYLVFHRLHFTVGSHPEVCPFHFETVSELANHVYLLSQNPELRSRWGKLGETFVKKNFSWKAAGREFDRIVKGLTASL